MKFFVELVACCVCSSNRSRRPAEEEQILVPVATDWKPSLSSISEDADHALQPRMVAANSSRNLKKKVVVAASRPINQLHHHRLDKPSLQVIHNLQVKSTQSPGSIVAKLKRWERKKCKPNSLPVLHKMHVKLGDTVKVISGHDKGKIGEITEIIKHNSKVVVREINLKTKHVKSRSEDEPGQIIKIEAPIHSSNVMLYSKEQKVASRVGHKTLDNGKRVRYLIKTGEIIDSAENWKRAVKEKEKTTEEAVAAAS